MTGRPHAARRPALWLRWSACLLLVWLSIAGAAAPAIAQSAGGAPPAIAPVDDAWRQALPRDAEAATQAYLDRLPAAAVARANAYFEGGYCLLLWNLLAGLAVSALLLARRRSARIAAWCLRVARLRMPADAAYGALFALFSFVVTLPLSIYQGWFRERQYGMATQDFGAWFGEQLIALAVSMVMLAIAVALLYALLRRAGPQGWVWASALATAMLALLMLAGPVMIDPLFNRYTPLPAGPVKDAVLAMAHADGVPVDQVYVVDASRQTARVSANVSGLLGTAAVRLNDNLLRRCSLAEIRAVMGHELGHYVMNHLYKMLAFTALLALLFFGSAQWALQYLLARHGAQLGTSRSDDVASFPLLVGVFLVLGFLATPIQNTLIRSQEIEADRFGLNLAREPHGAAELDLKLTEYRKPDPAAWEEFVFYDHPSTRFRIHDAMRWREAMGTP
ncbi:MAG: M48 family metalloprotease [Pseudomonadota bacterium]|nr:M48 family metalloprotease [Pseudomonadota bacterium]